VLGPENGRRHQAVDAVRTHHQVASSTGMRWSGDTTDTVHT
jgi:hypothetical protein